MAIGKRAREEAEEEIEVEEDWGQSDSMSGPYPAVLLVDIWSLGGDVSVGLILTFGGTS